MRCGIGIDVTLNFGFTFTLGFGSELYRGFVSFERLRDSESIRLITVTRHA